MHRTFHILGISTRLSIYLRIRSISTSNRIPFIEANDIIVSERLVYQLIRGLNVSIWT